MPRIRLSTTGSPLKDCSPSTRCTARRRRAIPGIALRLALGVVLLMAGGVSRTQADRIGTASDPQPDYAVDDPDAYPAPPASHASGRRTFRSVAAGTFHSTQENRDIEVTVLEMARPWAASRWIEVRQEAGVFIADGTRGDPPAGQSHNSDATGLHAGLALRLFLHVAPVGVFAEASAHLLWTPTDPFPAGGTRLNGFERWGFGISWDLSPEAALDAAYLHAHVSNGNSVPSVNPQWNGEGAQISLEHRF
jgi:hypothetical protein